MAITYNWTINPLEAYPTSSGEHDVVFVAHWQLHASEIVGETTYTAQSIGTQGLTYTSGSSFTPFEELTLEQVSGWVENAMGTGSVDNMKAGLATQIANQINPPVLTLQSPWLVTPTPVPTATPTPTPTATETATPTPTVE
jgi:hypothetical protein